MPEYGPPEREISTLADELEASGNLSAYGFADSLVGSGWDLPAGRNGWRRDMQEWAAPHRLIEPVTSGGQQFIAFTERGKALRAELCRRGLSSVLD